MYRQYVRDHTSCSVLLKIKTLTDLSLCFVCCRHNPILLYKCTICHQLVLNILYYIISNTTDAISGAGTAYPSLGT